MSKKDFINSDLIKWFNKLSVKEKNLFLKYTYWCTTEPKSQQRLRGFYIFCEANKIKNVEQLEK